MTSCRHARAVILATVRERASEAERLFLEEHLNGCPACRAEKAQGLLLERLREEPVPRLGMEARARVLRHLTSLPRTEPAPEPRRFLLGRPVWALAAATLLVSSLWVWRNLALHPSATSIRAQAAGLLVSAGAQIAYQAGTAFDVLPEKREIHLLAGEVDVDVVPGGPGRFRVITTRFTVEVLGTRFIVRTDGVRTLHGVVRVVDPAGRELAVVRAGQSWNQEQAALLAQQQRGRPVVVPLDSPDEAGRGEDRASGSKVTNGQRKLGLLAMRSSAVSRGSGGRPPSVSPPTPEGSSVDSLLAEARILVGAGDTSGARQRIATALLSQLTPRQRASAELLTANALLVERRYKEAVVAFRRTATLCSSQPEGELAVFALAQLLSEQGAQAEAQAVFRHYLDRYPDGRFVDEVRRQLHPQSAAGPSRSP